MKKQIGMAVFAMVLAAGCGSSAVKGTGGGGEGGVVTAGAGQALTVDLRMRATGTQQFQSLQLLADEVRVSADGKPLAVDVTGQPMELTQEDQAFLLGSVQVPAGTKELEVAVRLAPAGVFDEGNGLGWLDARATTLRFTSPVANVVDKHKAVVVLDAARSLVSEDADTVMVVPDFKVAY